MYPYQNMYHNNNNPPVKHYPSQLPCLQKMNKHPFSYKLYDKDHFNDLVHVKTSSLSKNHHKFNSNLKSNMRTTLNLIPLNFNENIYYQRKL